MTPAHLVASTSGEILTEYNMFQLFDIRGPRTGDPDDDPPVPTDADLVTTGANAATFHSALDDNYPHVTLELWSAAPPDPGSEWDRDRRTPFTVEGGQLRLFSQISREPGPHELAVAPGEYTMHVYCRGRADVLARAGLEDYPHGVERWLVRLWPA